MTLNENMSKTQTKHERVTLLKRTIEKVLADFIPKFDSFSLLDFPDHPNVGDSAIWLGETKYFLEQHGKHPSLVTAITRHSIDDTVRNLPDGPIFLHGGGNFGDVYPEHHAWREELLRRTKGHQVIQLPQSLYFKDMGRMAQTARAIAEHGNFSMLVRDHKSLEFAKQHFDCRVELCPDMAFILGPIERPVREKVDIFCLMRTDDEKIGYDAASTGSSGNLRYESSDWLQEDAAKIERLRHPDHLTRLKAARWGALRRSNYRNFGFHLMATDRLDRGLAMLSSGRWVLTDRLHAHILSTLLGLNHVVLDNSYGKLSSFIEAWTANTEGVFTMKTPEDAFRFISAELNRDSRA
ncbi:polysaccharide pyruvyl transferase family protein [Rhizobium esperanzae]|uniref:Pyruvyl transferase EpsO n=1 Tax=Rhizobium esperanzae TaxID=1967781 RepID=A0A7W6R484_9HYPH|nr:polysaccharide pyruvyl transferase family protein [Rhizobium esperanzae]MBB4235972.1 pyruvyl transferase EpsO [Rhizobium esperanzae]